MATCPKNHQVAAQNHAVCFRIYPRPRKSRLHFLVRIFGTKAAMTKGAAPYRHLLPKSFKAANVAEYKRDGRNKLSPQRGHLFFCLPHLDVGSAAHEILHTALAHARDIRLNLSAMHRDEADSPEEMVAEMMDTLTSQFLTGCRRRRIPVAVLPVGGN